MTKLHWLKTWCHFKTVLFFLPSKSCKVASLRLFLPRMAAASSHCFRLVGYSLPVSECLTLEFVIRITSPGSAKGTAVASKDLKRLHLISLIAVLIYYICIYSVTDYFESDRRVWIGKSTYLQSMSKAWPSLPITDTNWSMMPQGTAAWVCSACWQATAFATWSPSSVEGQKTWSLWN